MNRRAVGFSALLALLAAAAALNLRIWVGDLWAGRSGGDFAGYYLAALVGRAHGWAGIYDMSLYRPDYQAWLGSPVFGNLPLAAWAALPFTLLPFRVADVLWSLLLAAGFVWTWRQATGGSEWERTFLLLAALAAFPVLFAIHLGQLVLVVGALLVLHWRLLRAGHPVLAGIALGLAFLKPQDVALLPVVLLLSGRWKTAAACAATAALLATGVVVSLGVDGLRALHSTADAALAIQLSFRHAVGLHLPDWAPQLPVRAAIAVVALLPALAAGARRYERALMAGVLGAFLVTPYLNAEDLTLLFVCAWMVLRAGASDRARLGLLVAYPFVAFENLIGPVPLLLVELACLAALAGDSLGLVDRASAFLGRSVTRTRWRPSSLLR